MKVETGVMVVKHGKAWGVIDRNPATVEGWTTVENASIYDPRYLRAPEDVVYAGHSQRKELATAEIVPVKRTTTVAIDDEKSPPTP